MENVFGVVGIANHRYGRSLREFEARHRELEAALNHVCRHVVVRARMHGRGMNGPWGNAVDRAFVGDDGVNEKSVWLVVVIQSVDDAAVHKLARGIAQQDGQVGARILVAVIDQIDLARRIVQGLGHNHA